MYFTKVFWRATVVLVVLTVGTEAVNDSLNVQQLVHIPRDSLGSLADVWGFFNSSNSRYYALVCNPDEMHPKNGLTLIDITTPEKPVMVKTFARGRVSRVMDVKVFDNHVFVASEASGFEDPSSIWIYRLSAQHPYLDSVGHLTLIDDVTAGDTIPLGNCHNLFVTKDYLLLVEFRVGYDRLTEVAILKISPPYSPWSPGLLAVWNQQDFDSLDFGRPHDIFVRDSTAYIFSWRGGLYQVQFHPDSGRVLSWAKMVYDGWRGDVANITPHGEYQCDERTFSKQPGTRTGWVTDDGRYVLVGDEIKYFRDCENLGARLAPCLRIFDTGFFQRSDDTTRVPLANAFDIIWSHKEQRDKYYIGASSIDQVAPDTTPCPRGNCIDGAPPYYETLGVHNPVVKGRLAFLAWYSRGLHIVDISDMSDIKHVGYYDHETGSDGNWQIEAFGVYPFSPDGYIYVSGPEGFYVYRYGYSGVLDSNATWHGDIYIYDTLAVASGRRLVISAGTNVYMFKDAMLKVDGTLIANGTSSDSVKFIALGGNPQPGDWQGIYLSSNAACTLSYCSITKAKNGIFMASGSDARIDNSNIDGRVDAMKTVLDNHSACYYE